MTPERARGNSRRFTVGGAFWRSMAYAGARYGPTPWVRWSPLGIGLVFALALPSTRRVLRDNLRAMLGPRPRWVEEVEVLRTFVNYAHCLAESLGGDRPEALGAVREVVGREHVEVAVARGRGVVLVTAHVGGWDAAARVLAAEFGAPVMLVMEAEADGRARVLHDGVRSRGHVQVVHVGTSPLDALPILRHLRSGGIVAIQLDRPHRGGVNFETSLFGEQFWVPRGPFALAALTGAAVLPVFCWRNGYFDYGVQVEKPYWIERRSGPRVLEAAASRAVDGLRTFVQRHPTQWFHFSGLGAKSPA
jgi:lauroyl/myristoyl acyltransferase